MSISRHTAYNVLGAAIPIAITFATVPVYIEAIGEARYGILAVAWLLLGYFGVFDLGLGAATAQRIAAADKGTRHERAGIFWTALGINLLLGVIGGLVMWPVSAYLFHHVLTIDAVLRPEVARAIPWLVLAVPLATVAGVCTGALQGRGRFFELNFTNVVSSGLGQLVPLAVAMLHGPDLAWLVPAVLLTRLATLGLLLWRCRIHIFGGSPVAMGRSDAVSLLRFGGWVTVSAVIGPLMSVLDRVAIGALLGAKAVAHYTVPFQVTERFVLLPSAVSSAMFPRLASAGAGEARSLATAAVESLSCLMTPLAVLGVLLIGPFLGWWISAEFAEQAGLCAELLVIGFWVNAFAQVPFWQLRATSRPDLIAKCHMVEFIPYLAVLYVGVRFWGLPGAALAFLLRVAIDSLLLLLLTGLLRGVSLRIGKQALMVACALLLAAFPSTGTPLWWLGAAGVLLWSVTSSWTTAPEALRNQVARALHRFT